MCGLGKLDFEHIHVKAVLEVYKIYDIRVTLLSKRYFKLLLVVDTVSCL